MSCGFRVNGHVAGLKDSADHSVIIPSNCCLLHFYEHITEGSLIPDVHIAYLTCTCYDLDVFCDGRVIEPPKDSVTRCDDHERSCSR